MSPIQPGRHGFTLLELLLAMTVFAAVAAIVLPTVGSLLTDRRLTRGADQIRAELIRTRVRAMREGRVFLLKGRQDAGRFTIESMSSAADGTEAIDQTGSQSSLINGADQTIGAIAGINPTESFSRVVELPETVLLASIATSPVGGAGSVERALMLQPVDTANVASSFAPAAGTDGLDLATEGGAELTPIYFYPNGNTSNAAITITHAESGSLIVTLRGLTGDADVVEVSP